MDSDFWDISLSDITNSLPDWIKAFNGNGNTTQPVNNGGNSNLIMLAGVALIGILLVVLLRK